MATLGIYFWNSGSPELRLYKRSGGSWTQLGSAYSTGALAAGTQLEVDGGRQHDLVPGERRPADLGHRRQLHRRGAGHHGLRQRHRRTTGPAARPASAVVHSVGGTVSGLSGTVVLQDNGGDDLSVTGNGSFTFATPVASGAGYSVTVKTNPSGQSCTVSNGSGTVGSANVTNVAVSCSD